MATNYRCNDCEYGFAGKKAFIAHYRKEHPENGYGLWDAIGDLGDEFANGAMRTLQERNKHFLSEQQELLLSRTKVNEHAILVERFNQLAEHMRILHSVAELAASSDRKFKKRETP